MKKTTVFVRYTPGRFILSLPIHVFEVYLNYKKLIPQQGYRESFQNEEVLLPGLYQLKILAINNLRIKWWFKSQTTSLYNIDIPPVQRCVLELRYSRAWGIWQKPVIHLEYE